MKTDLQKLFEGENGLNEEFMAKVNTLIETKVDSARLDAIKETEDRMNAERVALVEAHRVEIETIREASITEVTGLVTTYLDAVVVEWANENAVALDSKIKAEAAENILSGAAKWFGEANIIVHGDADGALNALSERVAIAESEAAELRATNQKLVEEEQNRSRETILKKVCEGLALSQIETVRNCLEGIPMSESFESRATTFRALVEKKEGGDNDPKDPKDPKDKDPKDKDPKDPKKDDKDNELDESVKRQIAAVLNG